MEVLGAPPAELDALVRKEIAALGQGHQGQQYQVRRLTRSNEHRRFAADADVPVYRHRRQHAAMGSQRRRDAQRDCATQHTAAGSDRRARRWTRFASSVMRSASHSQMPIRPSTRRSPLNERWWAKIGAPRPFACEWACILARPRRRTTKLSRSGLARAARVMAGCARRADSPQRINRCAAGFEIACGWIAPRPRRSHVAWLCAGGTPLSPHRAWTSRRISADRHARSAADESATVVDELCRPRTRSGRRKETQYGRREW